MSAAKKKKEYYYKEKEKKATEVAEKPVAPAKKTETKPKRTTKKK